MYNNLLKRILFPLFPYTFFPIFSIPKSKFRRIMGKNGDFFYFENRKFVSLSFHILFSPFFPSPNPNFGASWEKMGIFSILKIESLFPSLSIYFFPHFCPSPNPNFGVSWGKMGLDPPLPMVTGITCSHSVKLFHLVRMLYTIRYFSLGWHSQI